jgi:ubiquinone/menaquinone biosynthesis C-methylase UbiE
MTDPRDKPEIAAAYDRWADTYDTGINRTRELASTVLRQRGLELAGRDVIEIGCGTGHNTQWLVERAGSVTALDFSEAMLRKAQARVRSPLARFLQHDVRSAWPLADSSADLIIVMLVFEHIEDLGPVFAEMVRTLRAGGELFLCELHPMRQIHGRQAEFTNPETGEHERIPSFLHDVCEYVNTGLRYGFELMHLGEWRDLNAPRSEMPRVLSLDFRLRAVG